MSGEGSRALSITQEPEGNFWKDEGGRSNKLRMTVQHPDGADLAVDVPLKFLLYYESGREVEKRDQSILNLCKPDYDPWVIPAGVGEVEIEFRLEKVSRRKDGQRFRICVEPDASTGSEPGASPSAAAAFEVEGIQCRPVCVMSKRRTGERVVSRRAPARAASNASYGASHDEFDHIHSAVASVQTLAQSIKKVQDNTFQAVMSLAQRMSKLEVAVAALHQHAEMQHSHQPPPAAAAPPAAPPSAAMPVFHGTAMAATSSGLTHQYSGPMRPMYGQLSQPISAMPSGPVGGTMPSAPPAILDNLPRQDSGPRRSGRRALKRDRSSGVASTSSLQAAMPSRPRSDDVMMTPAVISSSSSAGAAAAAAAVKEDEDDADEEDETALISAAHAGAYIPGAGGPGAALVARLPSFSSAALDHLTSKEWDGLNALSSAAGAERAKRPRNA